MRRILIALLEIRSTDLERSAAFYRLLGLELTRRREGSGPDYYACELGPGLFEIHPVNERVELVDALRFGFEVPSVEEAVQRMEAAGFTVVFKTGEDAGAPGAVLRDPDGHRVELTEPPARHLAGRQDPRAPGEEA